MSKLVAFRSGMDRNAETKEVDAFVMASLADFIGETGGRPAGAIVLWITEDGSLHLTFCNAERRDLAFAGAHLMQEALD